MDEKELNVEIIDLDDYEMDELDKDLEIEVLRENNEILEEHNDILREKLNENRVKLSHKAKKVAVTTVIAAGLAITLFISKVKPIVDGREKTLDKFYEVTSEYGIVDDSQAGYLIIKNGKVISFDQFIYEIREKIENSVDSELAANAILTAGLKKEFGFITAQDILGESYVSGSDLTNYYQSCSYTEKITKNK